MSHLVCASEEVEFTIPFKRTDFLGSSALEKSITIISIGSLI